jgi:basic membrane protein A
LEGAEEAASKVGAELEVADAVGYTDVAPVMRQLASLQPDLLIAHASGYRNIAPEVAQEFGVPTLLFNNPAATKEGIAANIDNKTHEGGYLAGVLAALMSETDTLGIAQSADVATWNRQAGGFVQGARSIDAEIEVRIALIGEGGFADVAAGQRITEQLIGAGADVIFGMGDSAAFGMIHAVETSDPPEGAEKIWFIDVIGNKSELDEQGIYLSSILWDFEPIFSEAIADINRGEFGTHGYEISLDTGALQLLRTDHIPDEVWEQVEAARAKLASGDVSVDDLTTFDEVEALIGK